MTTLPPLSFPLPLKAVAPAPKLEAFAMGRLQSNSFTYVCSGLESRSCRHSVTLVQTLDASNSLQVDAQQASVSGGLLMVAPQVPRVLRASGVPFLLVDIEPSHPHYRRFGLGAPADGVMCLDHLMLPVLREVGNHILRQTLVGPALDQAVRQAVHELAQVFPKPPELDERVRWMMSAIDQDPSRSLTDLARELSLSMEHASRLFSSQLGVGVRTYSLSRKIRLASRFLGRALPMTEIAQMAGFVDSAHFSKVWTRCYGRSPSAVFPADKMRMDLERRSA